MTLIIPYSWKKFLWIYTSKMTVIFFMHVKDIASLSFDFHFCFCEFSCNCHFYADDLVSPFLWLSLFLLCSEGLLIGLRENFLKKPPWCENCYFSPILKILSHSFLNSASSPLSLLFSPEFQLHTTWTLLHYSLCLQTFILRFCFFFSLRYILAHIFKVVFSLKHVKHCYFSFCTVQFQYLKSLWDCLYSLLFSWLSPRVHCFSVFCTFILWTVCCLWNFIYENFLRLGMMIILQWGFLFASAIYLGILLTQA